MNAVPLSWPGTPERIAVMTPSCRDCAQPGGSAGRQGPVDVNREAGWRVT
jgi:hypothetical protein